MRDFSHEVGYFNEFLCFATMGKYHQLSVLIDFFFLLCSTSLFFFGFWFLVFGFWFFFRDRVSLYSPGCPGTHFVDQPGLELRNPPASASTSQVLGLKVCAATAQLLLEYSNLIEFQTLHHWVHNNVVFIVCFV
jgi:hypothetical protein